MAGTGHHTGTRGFDTGCNIYADLEQSLGWEHYEVHEPEPHILLFKYVVSEHTPRAAS